MRNFPQKAMRIGALAGGGQDRVQFDFFFKLQKRTTDPPLAASHPSLAGINDGSTQSRKTGNMSGVLYPTGASALLFVLDFMRSAPQS